MNHSKQNASDSDLTYKAIMAFWLPLFATWLLMMVEGPLVAAIIARLPNLKHNLAAYGVALSLCMFFESPLMSMISASNALVNNRAAFLKLRNFCYALNVAITLVMLLMLIPPVFTFIVGSVMGIPEDIVRLSYITFFILLPRPFAIGYRRFYQGILIRYQMPRRVAYGTIVRLSTMGGMAFLCYFFFPLQGAYLGSLALLTGVLAEAGISRLMVMGILKKIRSDNGRVATEGSLRYGDILRYYTPLALTFLLYSGLNPVFTFFLGKSVSPIESLALFPVFNGFAYLFQTFGWSFQDVSIALLVKRFAYYNKLRRFAVALGIFSSGGLALIAISPLAVVWYQQISGLSADLTKLAILPTQIISLLPLIHCIIFFQRSVFIAMRKTNPVIQSSVLEVSGMIASLFVGIIYFHMVGIVAVAAAIVLGRMIGFFSLIRPLRGILKQGVLAGERVCG